MLGGTEGFIEGFAPAHVDGDGHEADSGGGQLGGVGGGGDAGEIDLTVASHAGSDAQRDVGGVGRDELSDNDADERDQEEKGEGFHF